MMNRTLGKNQVTALRYLEKYGSWPGGWVLTTPSQTRRVLESLVKYGVVETYMVELPTASGPRPVTHYRLTRKVVRS